MATNTSITVGSSTTEILPASSGRQWVSFQNDSNEDIYVSFGESAVLNEGILLKSGGGGVTLSAQDKEDRVIISETINAICTSGGKNLILTHK